MPEIQTRRNISDVSVIRRMMGEMAAPRLAGQENEEFPQRSGDEDIQRVLDQIAVRQERDRKATESMTPGDLAFRMMRNVPRRDWNTPLLKLGHVPRGSTMDEVKNTPGLRELTPAQAMLRLFEMDDQIKAGAPSEVRPVNDVIWNPSGSKELVPKAPGRSEQELIDLMIQRENDPQNLDLRDQEHAAFSRYVIDTLGPVAGRAVVAAGVPVYSGFKAGIQAAGGMKKATPASMREVLAGLKPLWERRKEQ